MVIATYNWATVLPHSIGSVLGQTFADFELLVVGDGCIDESADVVESIEDSRVRWINLQQRTGHQAGPNNEGQRQASGELIAYLGHDDLWLPKHLAFLVAAIDDGAAFAHSSVLHVDPHARPFATPLAGWTYSRGDWLAPTSVVVPRRTLGRIGGWRMPRDTGSLDPDADLWARVFDAQGPPTWVPHLTCVKLPAARRRDVYRTRPNYEQAYWRDRIASAVDPEASMLDAVDVPYELGTESPHLSFQVRAWRSLRYRMRKRLGLSVRATTRIRRNQRYKGL